MIEITQAGQVGKAGLLFDMHRLRARVFKDRLNWQVEVDDQGLEVDDFDVPDAVYLLALNKDRRVIGNWRLLSSAGPTMIRDLWPQFLKTLPMPRAADVWEVSRFAVDSPALDPVAAARETQMAIGEMFCALTELCIAARIRQIYTLYDDRIAKVIARIDCRPERTSEKIEIGGTMCQTGVFRTDDAMLQRLRAATGVKHSLIGGIDMPPAMAQRIKGEEELCTA